MAVHASQCNEQFTDHENIDVYDSDNNSDNDDDGWVFNQYTEMMEQFKELHKTVEELRTSGLSTGEIKKVCPTLTLFFFWKI